MKRIVWYILFVLVLLSSAIYSFHLRKQLSGADACILMYDKKLALMHNSVQNVINCMKLEARSEGFRLSPDLVVEDVSGNISALMDVFTEPTLVYRLTEMHCNSCIEHGIRLLKEECNNTKLPVMILCRYESVRKVRAICNSYSIDFPIFNTPERFNIPLDDMSTSYFFIVDESFKCYGFQTFIKEIPLITENYLKGICSSSMNLNFIGY